MDAYDTRPWLKLYPPRRRADPVVDYPDALTMFRAAVARAARRAGDPLLRHAP